MIVSVDFETRSPVDITTCGVFVYFEHPETMVLMCAYKIDDAPIKIWTYLDSAPFDLFDAIKSGAKIHAWNAQFETLGFDKLAADQGWPKPSYDQYVDTAAAAAAMALPRSLGNAAAVLGLDVQKDKDGMRLIRKFSMPRRLKKDEPEGLHWNNPKDHPEDWELFKAYCIRDVETELAVAARIMPLSDFEQQVWLLNEKINRRGIRIDRTSALAAIALADKCTADLDREMRKATDGFVKKCSEPAKLLAWCETQNVLLDSAEKAELTEALTCIDLPDHVRKALKLRQEGAKTSVAKLKSMLKRASSDGYVRGSSLYHAATTGRFSNLGVNFGNLPRPRRVFDENKPRLDTLFKAIRLSDPEALKLLYPEELDGEKLGRPMHLLSDAIRGFVFAAPNHDLMQVDYTGIEGVVIAWLAGEHWKLEALRGIIADPTLPDMYRRTAASIMNMTTEQITKKHPLRQSVGKVSELALGFGGGVAAFYSMARVYGVDLHALYDPVWGAADEERREKAMKRFESCLKRGSEKTDLLSKEAWIACEIIKHGWRASNSAIAQSWKDLETAMRNAVQNPGTVTKASRVSYVVRRGFLWALLPSGRCLAYGSPKLKDQVWVKELVNGEWLDGVAMDRDLAEKLSLAGTVKIEGASSPKLTALHFNVQTKKMERFNLYGGLAQQNNTQGTARDLLVNGMLRAEDAGYPICATVYDEIICEVPRSFGDMAAFERLVCELPDWAQGIPLTAGGWRGKRYRKD